MYKCEYAGEGVLCVWDGKRGICAAQLQQVHPGHAPPPAPLTCPHLVRQLSKGLELGAVGVGQVGKHQHICGSGNGRGAAG